MPQALSSSKVVETCLRRTAALEDLLVALDRVFLDDKGFKLREGYKHRNLVSALQYFLLLEVPESELVISGIWDENTTVALKQFQRDAVSVYPSGIIDHSFRDYLHRFQNEFFSNIIN